MSDTHDDLSDGDDRVEGLIAEIRRARGDQLARTHPEFEWAAREDTDFMERYVEFSSWMWDPPVERSISDRDRSIVWVVLLAYRGFSMTLSKQMRKAMAAGMSKRELIELLEVAVLPGGAPTLEVGLHALRHIEAEDRQQEGPR